MQDSRVWKMLNAHLIGEESDKDKEIFLKWFNQNEKNKELFYKVKAVWDGDEILNESYNKNLSVTFSGRFTIEKIKSFILKQALGHLVGFIIGMWVTSMFSHYVLEKRGLKNLFGLVSRKRIAVNEIPEWLQNGIAILVGFIALELINHLFQTKKHLIVWGYITKTHSKIKNLK